MLSFYEFLNEIVQVQPLPPIPNGMIRLTHVTVPQSAKAIMQTGFRYGRKGGIDSTTDAFSDNGEIISLIQTGKTGAFSRSAFGNTMVLMDMNNNEHRLHHNLQTMPLYVDPSRVLGYVDMKSGTFTKNPNYNPNRPVNYPRPQVKAMMAQQLNINQQIPIPAPNQTGAQATDVW